MRASCIVPRRASRHLHKTTVRAMYVESLRNSSRRVMDFLLIIPGLCSAPSVHSCRNKELSSGSILAGRERRKNFRCTQYAMNYRMKIRCRCLDAAVKLPVTSSYHCSVGYPRTKRCNERFPRRVFIYQHNTPRTRPHIHVIQPYLPNRCK